MTVRDKLAVLERRLAHLKKRIAAPPHEKERSYDIAEAEALRWALSELRRSIAAGRTES